jgi:cobalt/nickel transport system ATP-binding protein
MTPVLEVEQLTFGFHSKRPILSDISFWVEEGECVGILGANGAGKSTLLWCLLGLYRASGVIRLFGAPATAAARRRVGVVFQNPEDHLFMPAVLEDVALALINRGVPGASARQQAAAALERVGLAAAAERPASQLSLGERKRAAIAAALVGSPDLLLLDEPTAELDGRSVRELTGVLRRLPAARLIASHHLEFLGSVCTRILVLCEARVTAEGATAEILSDAALLERAGLV